LINQGRPVTLPRQTGQSVILKVSIAVQTGAHGDVGGVKECVNDG
jgi:hypothetical protein